MHAAMNHYVIWCELQPGVRDLDFAGAVDAWLGYLRTNGMVEGHGLWRRKLGFGPRGLGDWVVDIHTTDLAQLERAFQHTASRSGEAEDLHAAVFSKVTNTTFALYRDFPDPFR